MPKLPPDLRDQYEAQAFACLEAAALHREQLLAVACRLAGSDEAGRELFNEACLNCHDAIQHGGFVGSEFRFYIRKAIKNLHLRNQQHARAFQPLDGLEETPLAPLPTDARGALADDITQELATFPEPQQVAFHLHLSGMSYRQIAAQLGGDFTWIGKRIAGIKRHLRDAFGQAWANLDSE